MEAQFKIKENGFDEIKKKIILQTSLFALIAAGGGLAISHFNTDAQSSDSNTFFIIIPIMLGVIAFGVVKGINRQKRIFNSYKLIVNEERIVRHQEMTSDIEIPLNKIIKITKHKNGGFAIRGAKSNDLIVIPSQVENIEELELRLSQIAKITYGNEKTITQRFPWATPIIVVGLMITVYMSENKILVGISGVLLSIGLIYSLVFTQRSNHVDEKTKKGLWLILIVIFSVISIMYFKLFVN